MAKQRRFRLTLQQRRSIQGYLFISPFILGFLLFFAYPFAQSLIFSLSSVEITQRGYELGYVGVENYRQAILVNPNFTRVLVETLSSMASNIPLTITFSFFMATLLNQRFRGRTLARLIFFLPVILTAKILYDLEQTDYMQQVMSLTRVADVGGMLSTESLRGFLLDMRLPLGFIDYIIYAINRLPAVINSSAIPILIFLAALQSIPRSMYEAAEMEGATAWEVFWKITFPLTSSFILVVFVYSIMDTFIAPGNQLLELIRQTAFGGGGYGVSAAMGWIYFAVMALVTGVVIKLLSRYVYY